MVQMLAVTRCVGRYGVKAPGQGFSVSEAEAKRLEACGAARRAAGSDWPGRAPEWTVERPENQPPPEEPAPRAAKVRRPRRKKPEGQADAGG